MSREPTKHQLSSRLSYKQHTPTFLRRLQKNYGGRRRGDEDDEDNEEDEPMYGNEEFEDDGSGRPPIPVRPPIPERPKDNPGSEDEDGDEKPQVVVLKEGKHLTEREVENEKRKGESSPICFTIHGFVTTERCVRSPGPSTPPRTFKRLNRRLLLYKTKTKGDESEEPEFLINRFERFSSCCQEETESCGRFAASGR